MAWGEMGREGLDVMGRDGKGMRRKEQAGLKNGCDSVVRGIQRRGVGKGEGKKGSSVADRDR